jgi:multidrug efflux system membrane fusion protein
MPSAPHPALLPRPAWYAVLALLLAGCSRSGAPPAPPPVPVRVATVERRDMPVDVDAIGTVVPVAYVTVRSRVDGTIAAALVRDGQDVEAGTPLFELDSRPLEAALAQSRANLQRARSQADHSRADAERQEKLLAAGVTSREAYDTAQTQARVDAQAADAGEAAVRTAELDLGYAHIRAPIPGRAGSLLVHEGDVVKANETALIEINQLTPIDVRFTVPEQRLPAVQAALAAGPVPVTAQPGGSDQPPAQGELHFVDNAVDTTTGTIALKARFANQGHRLWPGQFVDVVMQVGQRPDAIVVPEQAIQAGQDGPIAFVIDAHDHAQLRSVGVDFSRGGRTVVTSGLAPGERVVIDGQIRLSPDAPVRVEKGPAEVADRDGPS